MIQLTRRVDAELFLGSNSIAPKALENGRGFTEVLCTELYPILVSYNTANSTATFAIDYRTQVQKEGKLEYLKPGNYHDELISMRLTIQRKSLTCSKHGRSNSCCEKRSEVPKIRSWIAPMFCRYMMRSNSKKKKQVSMEKENQRRP